MSEARLSNKNPDVILMTSAGDRIACHKSVLMKASLYFSAMFSGPYLENASQSVTIQGVEGFLLRQLVDLAYGRPFEAERAADLLGPSSMLQFTAVEQLCVDALKRTVADDTAAPLLELADALSQENLRSRCLTYILYGFERMAVAHAAALATLPHHLLLEILEHRWLRCADEMLLVLVVHRWLLENAAANESQSGSETGGVERLWAPVRFGLLTASQLAAACQLTSVWASGPLADRLRLLLHQRSDDPPQLLECPCPCHAANQPKIFPDNNSADDAVVADGFCPECLEHASDRRRSTAERRLRNQFCCWSRRLSKRLRDADTEDVADADRTTSEVIWTSPETLRWLRTQMAAPLRVLPDVACVVGHVHPSTEHVTAAAAGVSSRKRYRQDAAGPVLLAYDVDSRRFDQVTPLTKVNQGPIEASGYKVCAIGKDVYIFGGEYMLGYSNWNSSVWKYDSLEEAWSIETSLPTPRRHHTVCVADSSVYVIGGFGRHRVTLDTVDCYDTVGRTWRRCAPLAAPLYSCPACYLGGRLYVFTTQVWCYTPSSDSWKALAPSYVDSLPVNTVFSHAMVVDNERVYLTRGQSSELYVLDVAANSVRLAGRFASVVDHTCYVASRRRIVAFATRHLDADLPDDASATHSVQLYDVDGATFSAAWSQPASRCRIRDFGPTHTLGCFPLVRYSTTSAAAAVAAVGEPPSPCRSVPQPATQPFRSS